MKTQARKLIGWMEQREAVVALRGQREPRDGDDTTTEIARWTAARNAVMQRTPLVRGRPILAELPPQLADRGAAFLRRPDVVAGLKGLDWRLAVVDLDDVLSFQRAVHHGASTVNAASEGPHDWDGLFTTCLPNYSEGEALEVVLDPTRTSLTVLSLNPNLRVAGPRVFKSQLSDSSEGPGGETTVLGFAVQANLSFVQVALYDDRLYLRDGYHRCYGLLLKGVRHIPCILVTAHHFQETGASGPQFFGPDILASDRPPFVKDFLNDDVAAVVGDDLTQKVVRVYADEFAIRLGQ